MLLQKKITIDCSVDTVWTYFVNPNNWRNWYLKGIRDVQGGEWAEGALVIFVDGTGSRIIDFKANKILQLETIGGSNETWHFTNIGNGKTELLFESKFAPNVDVDQGSWNLGVGHMLNVIKNAIETF